MDDDVFFSPENFKFLVRGLDPLQNYFLGHIAYQQENNGISTKSTPFNLGGTYALSKAAARLLLPHLPSAKMHLERTCRPSSSWAEDVHFASK